MAGSGRLVFLAGEAGIGKSRLAREVTDWAGERGAVAVTGRAVPTGGSTAYRPLTEALLRALRDRPVGHATGLGPWLPALSAIIPVAATGGDDSGNGDVGRHPAAASAPVRAEAVLRLLRWLASPAGLVMVLEDLHWADPDTLAVVEYLSDNLASVPVLCLATLREEPATSALDVARRLHAGRAADYIAVARLDSIQTETMVRACLPDAGDDVVRRVQDAADGVPFLVEELLAAPGLPASFRDTVQARFDRLDDAEQLILHAAAVLGRHFDWRLLAAVTGEPAPTVSGALAHGVDQMLLSFDFDEFRFRHALTREAIVAAILPTARVTLAAAALAALEEARPGLPGQWREVGADLAKQSGQLARAGELLAASGREALSSGALVTAAETLRRAATLLDDTGAGNAVEAQLVEALAFAGRADEAEAVGAELLARLAADPHATHMRAQVHVHLAQADVVATRWAVAAVHVATAAELLAGKDRGSAQADSALTAQLLVLQAEIAFADGQPDRARQLAGLVLGRTSTAAEVRCHALEIVGRTERLRDTPKAKDAFESALAIADSAGLPFWRLRALHELGTIEMFDYAGTRRLTEARQMADELGAMSTAAVLELQLAASADARFELSGLAQHAAASLAISERLGLHEVRTKALLFLAESYGLGGDGERLEQCLAQAIAGANGDPVIEAFAWGAGRAMYALLQNEQAAALRAFERSAAILQECPNADPANFRGVWILVLAATGDERAAAELAAAHRSVLAAVFSTRGLVQCATAIRAGRRGEASEAEACAALAEPSLAGYPVWGDLGLLYIAEAALADGWGEPRRWLTKARDSFAAHGVHKLAQRCQAALEGTDPAPWMRFGVTAREGDVLRLVADGLANKEIAARLYLSPRTVEKHIESLLRKTGARSRTQLAVIAGSRPGT